MKKYLIIVISILTAGCFFTSCSDDEFDSSIFDTSRVPLDRTSYTFPLDTFAIENFLNPYNLRFLYRLEDVGSNMDYNLIPCSYEKSQEVAVLSKYLWFDVYKKVKDEVFLKTYSPKILHIIGSPAYNAASGTMLLGVAEGGKKITFYRTNSIDLRDIDDVNEKFFKTMHHEFSHILHQHILYPTDFRTLSNSLYDPMSWQERSDSVVLSFGCVTPYGSSGEAEDWVEVIANYIVKSDDVWNGMLNTASYGWETVVVDVDKWDPETEYRTFNSKKDVKTVDGKDSQYEVVRKSIIRDADGNPVLNDDGNVQYIDNDAVDGRAMLEKKLGMCRQWLQESFGINLDELRHEVQTRQYVTNGDGSFKRDADGKLINRLVYPLHPGSTETLLDSLLNDVNKFKELQN